MQMVKEDIRPGFIRISDIASAFAGYGKVPQNVLNYAADRGSKAHQIIVDLMNDIVVKEERYMFCGKSIRPYLDSWEKFMDTIHIDKIELQEERLYDEDLMTTGQPDLVAVIDGERVLIDWKATSQVGAHWEIQAAGYYELLRANGWTLNRMIFVKLDKDGEAPIVKTYHPNLDLLMKAYELYKKFFKDLKINLEMD
jgi:hypothetical protein